MKYETIKTYHTGIYMQFAILRLRIETQAVDIQKYNIIYPNFKARSI